MQNDPLDRAILATSRLAQGGNAVGERRRCATCASGGGTRSARTPKDAASLDLVMLVSDGLYFNNALDGGDDPGSGPPRRRAWTR